MVVPAALGRILTYSIKIEKKIHCKAHYHMVVNNKI